MALCRPGETELRHDRSHGWDILTAVDVDGAQNGFNGCGHDFVGDDPALRGVDVDVAVKALLKACSC